MGARTDIYYSQSLDAQEKPCSVYMFEPNPSFAHVLLKKVISLKHEHFVIEKAVGAEKAELFYYFDTQSFIQRSSVGTLSKFRSKKPLSVTTLDDYFNETIEIDFLKTDIEEMDYHALVGANRLLLGIKYIQFELGIGAEFHGRKVCNQDYWELLEGNFHLFVLRDANPIWQSWPNLPLLVSLDLNVKLLIEVLQKTGAGFNIVGIKKGFNLRDDFFGKYCSLLDFTQNRL